MINEPAFFSAAFALIMCAGIGIASDCKDVTSAMDVLLIAHLSTVFGLVGIVACVFWPVVGALA